MLLHTAVPSPLYHSKRFKLHPLADLFIPAPTRLLWEAFSHVAIYYEKNESLTCPPPSIARYSSTQLSYTAELTEASWRERKYTSFKTATTGIRKHLFRARVPHSTSNGAKLPRSTNHKLRGRTISPALPFPFLGR